LAVYRSSSIIEPEGSTMASELPAEEMERFFDARSQGYDEHMRSVLLSFDSFYGGIGAPIPATDAAIRVLDLGCGTGLELGGIWARAPRARITGIDLSAEMLARLQERWPQRASQLELIKGSYLEHPLGERTFDHAVSVMTLHHLPPHRKADLYARVRASLMPGGIYVEGDYVVEPAEEARLLSAYEETTRAEQPGAPQRHIDVPASLATQEALLYRAGFANFRVCWREGNAAIYTAIAPA
jgi:tRNA (cmo5U34)-methyltransferase